MESKRPGLAGNQLSQQTNEPRILVHASMAPGVAPAVFKREPSKAISSREEWGLADLAMLPTCQGDSANVMKPFWARGIGVRDEVDRSENWPAALETWSAGRNSTARARSALGQGTRVVGGVEGTDHHLKISRPDKQRQ